MTTFPLTRDVNLKMDLEIKARAIVYAREAYARFGRIEELLKDQVDKLADDLHESNRRSTPDARSHFLMLSYISTYTKLFIMATAPRVSFYLKSKAQNRDTTTICCQRYTPMSSTC